MYWKASGRLMVVQPIISAKRIRLHLVVAFLVWLSGCAPGEPLIREASEEELVSFVEPISQLLIRVGPEFSLVDIREIFPGIEFERSEYDVAGKIAASYSGRNNEFDFVTYHLKSPASEELGGISLMMNLRDEGLGAKKCLRISDVVKLAASSGWQLEGEGGGIGMTKWAKKAGVLFSVGPYEGPYSRYFATQSAPRDVINNDCVEAINFLVA